MLIRILHDIIKIENPELFPVECIYHYTTLDGFISILENRDFWISNINFMNDSREFIDGKNMFIKYLKNKTSQDTEHAEFYNELENIVNSDSSTGFYNIDRNDIFALSFCDKGDLLTQWQVYGKNGIAIGFENELTTYNAMTFMNEERYIETIKHTDPNKILPNNEIKMVLHNVIYKEDLKIKIFSNIIDKAKYFLDSLGEKIYEQLLQDVTDALFTVFPLMKDINFEHEREKRFLYPVRDENIHFRNRNGIILPYIKMKILDVNCRPHIKFPVKEIVIAPGDRQEYIATSVKYFLQKTGYDYLVDKVRTSRIPYR